jgi:hypothetical protein
MSCYHGPCHHWGHHGCGPGYGCHHRGHGYGAGYVYGPPPGQPVPFPARRGRRARDLEDYAEDLEEELARVRRELQELRRAETPEG